MKRPSLKWLERCRTVPEIGQNEQKSPPSIIKSAIFLPDACRSDFSGKRSGCDYEFLTGKLLDYQVVVTGFWGTGVRLLYELYDEAKNSFLIGNFRRPGLSGSFLFQD